MKNTIFHILATKIRLIKPDEVVKESLDKDQLEFLADLNREQLQNSTNVKGDSLGEYAQNTANIYNEFRTTRVNAGSPVKLYDTGELYESIEAELQNNKINVKANYDDAILGKLEEVYGAFIGLSKESLEKASQYLKPSVRDYLKLILRRLN